MDPPSARQNSPTPKAAQTSPFHDEDCAFCQIITAYPVVSPSHPTFPTSEELNPEKLYPPAFVLLSTEHVVAFLDIFPLVRGHVLLCPRRHAEKVGDMTSTEGVEDWSGRRDIDEFNPQYFLLAEGSTPNHLSGELQLILTNQIGRILPLLSRAVTRATMPDIPHAEVDYNVVQNNGPGAAQVVPHTHFHIVPRYPFDSTYQPYSKSKSNTQSTSEARKHPRPIPQGTQATAILFGRGQRHYRDDEDAEGLIVEMRRCVAEEWKKEFGEGSSPVATMATDEIDGGESRADSQGNAVRTNKTVREDEGALRLAGNDGREGSHGRDRGSGRGRGNL